MIETAEEFFDRATNKYELGDTQGALSDLNRAAILYEKQCNTEMYLKVIKNRESLRESLEKGFWGKLFS